MMFTFGALSYSRSLEKTTSSDIGIALFAFSKISRSWESIASILLIIAAN